MLLCAAVLSACEKDGVQQLTGTVPAAAVKFFNFGVNAPGVDFYANDTKITGVVSTIPGNDSKKGTVSGGAAAGGLYSSIAPGAYTLSGRIAPDVTHPGISNLPATLTDGKYYSLYLSGFYNTTAKTVDSFIVEDPFPAQIDYMVAYVRFVNAISNANPMTLYEPPPARRPRPTK